MNHIFLLSRFRFTGLLLAIALLLGVGVLVLHLLTNWNTLSDAFVGSQLTELSQSLRSMDSILTTVRLSLLVGLFFGWRKLIPLLATWHVVSTMAASKLHQYRGRILIWLLIIELVIGQRLFQHLVELLTRWL